MLFIKERFLLNMSGLHYRWEIRRQINHNKYTLYMFLHFKEISTETVA